MKLLISGLSGKIGTEIYRITKAPSQGMKTVGGVCRHPPAFSVPWFPTFSEVSVIPDCVIDASHPSQTEALLDFSLRHHLPTVIATTGQNEAQTEAIRAASREIPIFQSPNFALGLAFLSETLTNALPLFPCAEIEIIETHHNRKRDAPSGTALALANQVGQLRETSVSVGRKGSSLRPFNEIGIHSVRIGNAVGKHEILLWSEGETITLSHEVQSRSVYAEGILRAVSFLCRLPMGEAGLFSMRDLFRSFSVNFKDQQSNHGEKT